MGFNFRKSFKILPGVRVNIGKKGISSVSIGPKGTSLSIGRKGAYINKSIGGGLTYRHELGGDEATDRPPTIDRKTSRFKSSKIMKILGKLFSTVIG